MILNKRILMVAPSSLPINGPEAMVNAKHIYLLCKAGCSVDLICRGIRKQNNIYPTKEELPYLYQEVNSIIKIVVDTQWNLRTLFRHFRAYLKSGYVYKASDWSLEVIQYCEKKLHLSSYDYVFTKDYPSEIVGVYLAKKYDLKWIPTWNDPYMWKKYPQPYGKGPDYKENILRKRLIKDIGKYSFINIFPSLRLEKYMLSYMRNMREESCVVMPHILLGQSSQIPISQSGILRIIHAGSIGKERDPTRFLLALQRFIHNFPQRPIRVDFLGAIERTSINAMESLIEELGLNHIVSFRKPVPYFESLNIVREYEVCLVIEAACKEGIFLPSKVVDYLQNNKTIFAVSPVIGTLADLHAKGVIDYFADVLNEDAIYATITDLYQDFLSGKLNKKKNLSEFEYEHILHLHQERILI